MGSQGNIFIKCSSCGTLSGYSWHEPVDKTTCKICVRKVGSSSSNSSIKQPLAKVVNSTPKAAVQQHNKISKSQASKKTHNKTVSQPSPLALPIYRPLQYEGIFYDRGDIVTFPKHGRRKYGFLKRLFGDQYGEKYALITWLKPTSSTKKNGSFDLDTYTIHDDEWNLRFLYGIKFVCHAPQASPLFWIETKDERRLLYGFGIILEEKGEFGEYTSQLLHSLLPGENFDHPGPMAKPFWDGVSIPLEASQKTGGKMMKKKQNDKGKLKLGKTLKREQRQFFPLDLLTQLEILESSVVYIS